MTHEPRLARALRELLAGRRSAALAIAQPDAQPDAAAPLLSFVPYAVDAAAAQIVLHVSALAAHTQALQAQPLASLLVTAAEADGEPVHALARVSLNVRAAFCAPQSLAATQAQAAYLARFPEAAPMTTFGDFCFVALTPLSARHVAGFGAARDVDADELARTLRSLTPQT